MLVGVYRLRLVRVKAFPENRYFPEMLFSGKEIFSCVWLHFKKNFGKYFLMFGCVLENTIENTFSTCCSHFLGYQTNTFLKSQTKLRKKIIKSGQTKARSRSVRSQSWSARSVGSRSRSARSELCAITIEASRDRDRDRDRRFARCVDRDHDWRRSAQCLDRSLSLSLRTISLSRCVWSCVSGVLAECVALTATEIIWR